MKKYFQIAFGLAISLFLLWWVFRDTQWREVGQALANMHWGYGLVGLGLIITSFFTRTKRWSYIVRTAGPVPFSTLFHATQIGFLANFTLPLRAGEPIRALALSLRTTIPFTKSFAFVALDRVTDVFSLVIVLVLSLVFFRPTDPIPLPASISSEPLSPEMMQRGATVLAVAIVVAFAGLMLVFMQQQRFLRLSDCILRPISKTLAEKVHVWFSHFAEGLTILRHPMLLALSLAWSLPTWGLGMLGMAALMWAFDVAFPWYAPIVIQSTLAIVISLPGAPGFVGQFHAGIVAGLIATVPAMSDSMMDTIAIVAHLANMLPVVLIGLYSLQVEGVGLLALRRESEEQAEALEQQLEAEVEQEWAADEAEQSPGQGG